jgi:hypothetical protein
MRRGGERLGLGGLLVMLALGGCSFASVYRPPPRDQWPTEKTGPAAGLASCTTEPIAPIVDGVITAGLLLGGGYVATQQDALGFNQVAAAVLFVPGIVFLASTIYGFSGTSACRAYRAGPPYSFQLKRQP